MNDWNSRSRRRVQCGALLTIVAAASLAACAAPERVESPSARALRRASRAVLVELGRAGQPVPGVITVRNAAGERRLVVREDGTILID